MTMNTIQWTQRLPWPGKLGFARARAAHLADAESLEADEVERQLLARAKVAYFELAAMDRIIAIMTETRELLRSFFEVSATRYAVGTGLQQDVLQAQVAVARTTEDLVTMGQRRLAMAARLNALLGRDATAPIGGLELDPPSGDLPRADTLMSQAAAARPALAAARARVEAAQDGYRAAGRAVFPDFTVTLGYGQRPQFDDLATLMVGISIPLWAGARQRPLQREMQIQQAAAEARERDLYNETYANLTELRAQADRAGSLTALYRDAVLPQAEAAVESALAAYRVGRVDYSTLVNSEMTVNRYRIETVRLAAEYHQAVAQVEALVGTDLGGTR
jgi:outer membrane protein TolC